MSERLHYFCSTAIVICMKRTIANNHHANVVPVNFYRILNSFYFRYYAVLMNRWQDTLAIVIVTIIRFG